MFHRGVHYRKTLSTSKKLHQLCAYNHLCIAIPCAPDLSYHSSDTYPMISPFQLGIHHAGTASAFHAQLALFTVHDVSGECQLVFCVSFC